MLVKEQTGSKAWTGSEAPEIGLRQGQQNRGVELEAKAQFEVGTVASSIGHKNQAELTPSG